MLEFTKYGEPRSPPLATDCDTPCSTESMVAGLFETTADECAKLLMGGGGSPGVASPRPQLKRRRQSLSRQSINFGRRLLLLPPQGTPCSSSGGDSGCTPDAEAVAVKIISPQQELYMQELMGESTWHIATETVQTAAAVFEATSPPPSQEALQQASRDRDAEERSRPENEIDSHFGSDDEDDEDDEPSSLTILKGVRGRNNHNNPFRGTSTASSTSTSDVDGDDGDEDDWADESGWPATPLLPDLFDDSSPDAVEGYGQEQPYFSQALRRQRRRSQWRLRRRRQQQNQRQPPALAPLVFQTLTLAISALYTSIRAVARDAENYIVGMCQEQRQQEQQRQRLDTVSSLTTEKTLASSPCVTQLSTSPSPLPARVGNAAMDNEEEDKAVTALRAAAGLALCLLVWLFARLACLLGPELMFGVSFMCVAWVVQPGCPSSSSSSHTQGSVEEGGDIGRGAGGPSSRLNSIGHRRRRGSDARRSTGSVVGM